MSCHLSKSTAAHGEHTPTPPSIFKEDAQRGTHPCGDPFFLIGSPPNQAGQAVLQLCALLSLAGLGGVTRRVLGSHSLDSRHVWGRHGADFLGFLQGVLLVKGLLLLLLVLQRKQGHCSVGCWGSEGKLSHWEQ